MQLTNKMGLDNENETMLPMTAEGGVADESLKMGDMESIDDTEHQKEIFQDEDDHHAEADYSKFSKKDFVELVKELSKDENFKKIDAVLKEVKPLRRRR